MKYALITLCLAQFVLIGCATNDTTAPTQKTQLEIREFQTRTYPTNDVKYVMKVLLNVLQDDGYVVQNASTDIGLLSATKRIHMESTTEDQGELPTVASNVRRKKNSTIDATVNVSEFGKECKVRVSFLLKFLKQSGSVRSFQVVDDLNYYQRFFAKVDKGLFLQAEKL